MMNDELIGDYDDVLVDDEAEPEDANIDHEAGDVRGQE